MPGRVEMSQRMGVGRIFATSDVAAGEANAKLVPRGSECLAFLAPVGARDQAPDVGEVFALIGHRTDYSIAALTEGRRLRVPHTLRHDPAVASIRAIA